MFERSSRVAESQGFAQSLLKTLALREKQVAQSKFLEELSRTPLFHQLILRGGCALHRVFLHQRYTGDIDFLASPEVTRSFVQTAQEQGLKVEQSKEHPEVATYALDGRFYDQIVIGIDITGKSRWFFGCELSTMTSSSGTNIPVRVQPLEHILAEKLACVSERCRAVDFLDIWLALNEDATLKTRVRGVLGQRSEIFFRIEPALENLNSVEDEWDESLDALLSPVPEFEEVRRDLRELLPFFADAPASLLPASNLL